MTGRWILVAALPLVVTACTARVTYAPGREAPGTHFYPTANLKPVFKRPFGYWGEEPRSELRLAGELDPGSKNRPLAAGGPEPFSLQAVMATAADELASVSLRRTTPVRAQDLDRILRGTGLEGLGVAFLEAQETWGVNALALVAIAAHESSWGQSRLARTRNNLFGFGAYTGAPENAHWFKNRRESIMAAARYLRQNYLEPEGRHHRGYALKDVGKSWAADPKWAQKVARAWKNVAERLLESAA